jgi:ATP-binding cassette, subfamily B, bacterial MsbA
MSKPAAPARRPLASTRPLARLLPLVRPYRSRLLIALAALLVAASAGLAFPMVLRFLLDAAFVLEDRAALDSAAILLVTVFGIQAVMNFVQVYLLTATTERIIATLRQQTYAHLVHLSPAFFAERRAGELTSRLSSDLTVLQSFFSTWLSELTRQSMFLVGGIIMLSVTNPRLTMTTLAVVPLAVGAALVFGRALRRASTGVQDRVAEAMGMADESFGAIRTVQSFTREEEEIGRFGGLLDGVVQAAVLRARMRALFFSVVGFIAFGAVAAVMWQGGVQVLEGRLTAGALVAFLFYAMFVAAAVGSLASLFGHFQEAVGAATRVFELLDSQADVREPEFPVHLPTPVRGAVRYDGVSFRYGDDLPEVISDISLSLEPGEVVALVGRSGAGKTTIASLLPRFWDVSSGRITLDGHDVRTLQLQELRRAIGIVPQEPVLFSGTIRENIIYARPDASEDELQRAARAGHAAEFIDRLPAGWETRVGERGVKLSGGQRQRIAIARVFLKDPAIVLLDEATSSLDSESERLIEAALEELLEGRTTLIIAHRLSTVRRADRVLVLDGGCIVESGSHAELAERAGLYAKLYAAQ